MEISNTTTGSLSLEEVHQAVKEFVEKKTGKKMVSCEPVIEEIREENFGSPTIWHHALKGFDIVIEY